MNIVAVTGPECCGKTELCDALSERIPGSVVVPEFARIWLGHKQTGYQYSYEDVVLIAREQHRLIESARSSGSPVVLCDSDYLVLKIWMQEVFGKVDKAVEELVATAKFDLVLLCAPDIPWTPDPLRENPHDRDRLFELYRNELIKARNPFSIITGIGEMRTEAAWASLGDHLTR